RRFGYTLSQRRISSAEGGSARRLEVTNVTGLGSRPTASTGGRPACRSPRASAAPSEAQRRESWQAPLSGGSVDIVEPWRSCEYESSVNEPASGRSSGGG